MDLSILIRLIYVLQVQCQEYQLAIYFMSPIYLGSLYSYNHIQVNESYCTYCFYMDWPIYFTRTFKSL